MGLENSQSGEMSAKPDHSIVFLTYNKSNLIDSRLHEVAQHFGREDVEVVVFNNGSTDRTVRLVLISHAQLKLPLLKIVHQDHNLGFSQGFNRAVEHTRGEKVYLVSDDVSIFGDIVEALADRDWSSSVFGHRIIAKGAGWNDFPEISIPYLDGYFLAMKRGVWDWIGGFDERYSPYDFEDIDLSYTVQNTDGLEICEVPSLPIRHQSAGTIGYNPDRYNITCENRAKFARKWGRTNDPERP